MLTIFCRENRQFGGEEYARPVLAAIDEFMNMPT
jgi:hypothetical protein